MTKFIRLWRNHRPLRRQNYVLLWVLFFSFALLLVNKGLAQEESEAPVKVTRFEDREQPRTRHHIPYSELAEHLKMVDIISRNFSQVLADENIWLIEFYAPWCVHCGVFMPTYADMAKIYHSTPERKIKIARVNAEEERALASRFGIYGYPSFFVVDGWSVYEFEESRSKQTLMKFVEGGYKNGTPMPFYLSPLGPIGLIQGFVINTGLMVMDIYEWLQVSLRLSPILAGSAMFISIFMGSLFLIVVLAVCVPAKAKRD